MKFAPYFIALALFSCANAAPAPEGQFTDSKFFEGTLDSVQGAILDMLIAGENLDIMEAKLEELVRQKQVIFDAETILEAAVDAAAYDNEFKHTHTA